MVHARAAVSEARESVLILPFVEVVRASKVVLGAAGEQHLHVTLLVDLQSQAICQTFFADIA